MTGCEKCWTEAGRRLCVLGGDQTSHYLDILTERVATPCTPEEQCGDLHVLLHKDDGSQRCRCGKREMH